MSLRARSFFVGRTLRGYRFETTDDGWAHGSGDELLGPASALALAILGPAVRRVSKAPASSG